MLLATGEVIHVIERRGFDGDIRRHFLGEVEQANESAVRVSGYVFAFTQGTNTFAKSTAKRTRIISLLDAGLIINVAPPGTQMDKVRYTDAGGRLIVTDDGEFSLEINEFSGLR